MSATAAPYRHLLALAQAEQARRADPRPWMEANLSIRTKDQRVVPFHFNWAQQDYYLHRTRRDLILKARQMGFTTLICGLFFADCLLRPNTTSVIVAHDLESATRFFGIIRLFWERLPEEEKRRVGKPRYSNRKEFFWPERNAHFYVGTAGSLTFGRGQTIQNLHCSEFAFWPKPEETLIALTEAVPQEGRAVLESTANGVGNAFHDQWLAAKEKRSGFAPSFYVWWEDPSYRLAGEPLGELDAQEQALQRHWKLDEAQLRWRRDKRKLLRDKFVQEYPEDDATCFLVSGRGVFDVAALQQAARRIAASAAPERGANLTDKDRTYSIAPATLLVWQRPQEGKEYVIGADVGEGLEQGDASCAIVLAKDSGAQVAELHGRIPADRFAQLLYVLGKWYHTALLAVEKNNHGHTVLNLLRNQLRYRYLYYHVRYDHKGQAKPDLGWPTDAATKPILVDDLAAAIAGEHLLIRSSGLVEECFTFITTDSGSQEAQEGKYDDRVMAAGIAWQARKRARPRAHTTRPPEW